ncbi:protein RER1 isoform X1 [Eurytemora carolleeae]|uniref:protein RER1 isoform X1 n=1 Tax=Eurytemora carolleeae TaxID=1294199 RepID=UPI000C75A7EF|nr:protein RER1 isoform X1 [Eurytemora carolleeae]|eukprot:XP_023327727.1 protein RER1-like isoform X1 [Eurytemora affinis]
MMEDAGEDVLRQRPSMVLTFFKRLGQTYQLMLDRWTPYTMSRWATTVFLILAFIGRIIIAQGWYIVTYALAIYHLNLFLAFLTPKIDPAMSELDDDEGPELPTRQNEEFRPFIRRLPEFKFWYSATKATVIAFTCTFFELFNVPVFWPILVMYFLTLFCITMKRQIKHMIRYRYIPFTWGKPKFQVEPEYMNLNLQESQAREDAAPPK